MFRYSLVCVAGLCLAAPAPAASWAEGLFEELSKDFGSVARGPMLEHPFRLVNTTGQLVHIASLRVSCGCVTAVAPQPFIEPGKSAVVEARMDTRRFLGTKSVTVYVQFDQPQWEEVQLQVQANSRDDLVVAPEAFALGRARRGSSPAAAVTVTFYGNDQWQIVAVERESSYVRTELRELRRDAGQVSYEVTARIRPETPAGKWYTDVWLKTNSLSMPRVRVPLTIDIEPALSVSSPTVALGEVRPGEAAVRKLIVRGPKPFRITAVQGTDGQVSVKDSTAGPGSVHVLTITVRPTEPGELARRLKVITDLPDEGEVEFETRAQVVQ